LIRQIPFNGKFYTCAVWAPLLGSIGDCSFDTETTLIENGMVPDFIVGSAFNGSSVFFLTRSNLAYFLEAQSENMIFMANAAFDISVSEKICGPLWKLVESGSVIDVLLLKQLLDLAKEGAGSQFPSLDQLSAELLGVSLPKDAKSSDGQDIRTTFSRFLVREQDQIAVSYGDIPWDYLSYAGIDAIATFLVAQRLLAEIQSVTTQNGVRGDSLLSHDIQLKAAYAFSKITNLGIAIDPQQMAQSRRWIAEKAEVAAKVLKEYGWLPGGVDSSLREIISRLAEDHQMSLPTTKSGKISVSKKLLNGHRNIPFIKHYLDYARYTKLLQFLRFEGERIHPKFCTMVSTGRSSAFSPNVQQLPREDLVRSVFKSTDGHVFLGIDYSQIELRVLAQITFRQFGESHMRNLLNHGEDLHRYFAGEITGKLPNEVSLDERNKAKACNFGFPGGLGIKSFIDYAKDNYGVLLSDDEAEDLRNRWLATFPEVSKYLEHDDMHKIIESGILEKFKHPEDYEDERAVWILRGILCGQKQTTSTKRHYTEGEIEWAFSIVKQVSFPNKNQLLNLVEKRRGNWVLWQSFSRAFNSIKFPSGRIRSWLGYTECKNNLFQGIAADGAKEGLYGLVREGFRVVNFIHDEYLIEIPLDTDLEAQERGAKRILIEAMKRHCPDVAIEVEASWMIKWQKRATHMVVAGCLMEINERKGTES
jgi:DNA polymerase I-like protein with 3'-5' exonuclease and polymerase domains